MGLFNAKAHNGVKKWLFCMEKKNLMEEFYCDLWPEIFYHHNSQPQNMNVCEPTQMQ